MIETLITNLTHLNIISVLVCAITVYVLGGLWYGVIFKSSWEDFTGVDQDDSVPFKLEIITYSAHAFGSIAIAIGYHVITNILISPSPLVSFRPELSYVDSLFIGFVLWLFFIVPTGFFHVLFAQKPLQLWALDSFYWLSALLVTAMVSFVWPY